MNKSRREVRNMTDRQTQMLEAIKIIVEKAKSKEEAIKDIKRIQSQGKKKPQ